MKISVSLSAILAILPALALAASPLDGRSNGDMYFPRHHARSFGRQRQGAFGQGAHAHFGQDKAQQAAAAAAAAAKGKDKSKSSTAIDAAATAQAKDKGKDKNKNKDGDKGTSTTDTTSEAASGTTTAAAASSSDATASVADNNGNDDNDPDTSLNLLPTLVATGLEQNGQETQEPGQVPSITSKNNFINFCAGKTITNGQQITTGSCDPIPMGDIIPNANMPSAKFKFPTNFGTVPANQNFTIQMALINMQAGNFTNAEKTYYMAPQQLNSQNIVIGHTHVVIQKMAAFDDPTILDASTFTFFKGINTAQDGNNIVTAEVAGGVPAGNYRLASINTDANHAPVVVAKAQHGFGDDMIYFTAT